MQDHEALECFGDQEGDGGGGGDCACFGFGVSGVELFLGENEASEGPKDLEGGGFYTLLQRDSLQWKSQWRCVD